MFVINNYSVSLMTELELLRGILVDRYRIKTWDATVSGTLSELLMRYTKKDSEAYLYCLFYEKRVRFKKSRLFPVMFEYPKLVQSICNAKELKYVGRVR